MPTISIHTSPIGSQLTSTIASDESADKNDFPIYITRKRKFHARTERHHAYR